MKQRGPEVFRITGARAGLTEDVRARQRRYVISMSIRTVAVILTVVLWNVERPLAWVTLVLGALLPYIAVVYANAGRENVRDLPTAYLPPTARPMLEAGRHTETGPRPTGPREAAGTPAEAGGPDREAADEAAAPPSRTG